MGSGLDEAAATAEVTVVESSAFGDDCGDCWFKRSSGGGWERKPSELDAIFEERVLLVDDSPLAARLAAFVDCCCCCWPLVVPEAAADGELGELGP